MAVPEAVKVLTEYDLIQLDAQGQRYEIVRGELVEMSPVGLLHTLITGNIYRALYEFTTPKKLGYVCGDNLIYVLHIDPKTEQRTIHIPDVSFIRKGRLPQDFDLSRPFPGAPDLAIEVMSPADTANELLNRIHDYFTYGTQQVWVFYPEQKEIHQHRRENPDTIRTYRGSDQIDTAAIFPGLELITDTLFIVPDLG